MKKKTTTEKPATPKMTVYEIVNERIMDMLKQGAIPWHKPWSGTRDGAISHVTGRPYSLLNQLLLQPGEYITFNQCTAEGGKVKKGAKSNIVVFWKQTKVKETEDGNEKTKIYPLLRYYRVFHIDDCEGITPKYSMEDMEPIDIDEEAERIAAGYFERSKCKLVQNKRDKAAYSPSFDTVFMPMAEQFDTSPHYYATLFHEIGHSTGHSSRLSRFESAVSFGDVPYSKEELVAELSSASILNRLGVETGATIKNTAAYIQSWLRALQDDTRMLVWAAGRADKAVRLIMNESFATEVAGEEQAVETAEEQIETPTTATASTITAAPTPTPTSTIPQQPAQISVSQPAYMIPSVQMAAYALAESSKKQFSGTEQEAIAGAWLHNGKQYIASQFLVAAYDVPIQNLPTASTEVKKPDFHYTIAAGRSGSEIELPVLAELKSQYKLAKGRKKKYTQYTLLAGEMYVNTAYLIQAMELAGITEGVALMQDKKKPLYMSNVGCEVVLCPVNLANANDSDVWTPKSA